MTVHAKVEIRYPIKEYPDGKTSFDKALSKFFRKVNKNRHLKILKERNRGYKKPSLIKHELKLATKHKREIAKRRNNRRKKY